MLMCVMSDGTVERVERGTNEKSYNTYDFYNSSTSPRFQARTMQILQKFGLLGKTNHEGVMNIEGVDYYVYLQTNDVEGHVTIWPLHKL